MVKAQWHSMNADQILKELDADPHRGLTDEEVERRLERYGSNELKKEERISPFSIFIHQFRNILIIILLIAIVLSALIGEIVDAMIIGVIVVFSAVLGFVQEFRAEKALEALKKMLSPTITVLRNGKEEEVPSKMLVPGDVLLLEAGDKISADARLLKVHSLKCDEAPLTGESVPIVKDSKPLAEDARVSDRKNMVFTGTTIVYGRGRAVVTSTGMNTEFGMIAKELAAVKKDVTPLEKRTEEIGKWLGAISLGVILLVVGISVSREALRGDISMEFIIKMLMFGIALAVAAVPEALAAIVTGALAIGMHEMAKKKALIRRMPAVETLGSTTVICSDKTGTLTKGEMTVKRIFLTNGALDVTGTGYTPEGEFKGSKVTSVEDNKSLYLLLQGGLLCNDSLLEKKDDKWSIKGDPTEGALVVAATKAGLNHGDVRREYPRFEEIPFSSERKRMTTIHKRGDGTLIAFMKGAPEVVLERCSYVQDDAGIRPLSGKEKIEILKINGEMAKGALRVIGIASRELPGGIPPPEEAIERGMVFLGLEGMIDPPREEAIEATKVCKQVHIKPIMITGDHKLTAVAVAKEIGIYKEGDLVLTGAELEKLGDSDFEKIVAKVTVYARVSPLDKIKIVKAWKTRGEVVAMTGDGVNDAPALKHADIGIAMGITGTDVTKEAADMILSDDNFATIVSAIERGRWIYDNIKKYLVYLIESNVAEVVVIGGIVLALGPEFLPLLPAAILYINLATDGLPALALGVAPPDPDIMRRPPRDPKASVFGWDVKSFILRAVLIEVPLYYFIFFRALPDLTHARTVLFFLFIVIELVIALNCRSLTYSIFKAPPHKWLVLALIWEIVLIAVLIQIPGVREAFGIMKPTFSDLTIIVVFAFVVFAIIEATKLVLRKKITVGRRIST
ncbi:MAG: cation-translocating P-type ATPase [Candidatus Hydrothermarchaeales archaeon]